MKKICLPKKEIDYKYQLERLKEVMKAFQYDKILGNALNDYDKGHQKASKDTIKDSLKLVDLALKGKL